MLRIVLSIMLAQNLAHNYVTIKLMHYNFDYIYFDPVRGQHLMNVFLDVSCMNYCRFTVHLYFKLVEIQI